jgi:signal transduction histidine kinase/ActR/RegA family two-component response regulator
MLGTFIVATSNAVEGPLEDAGYERARAGIDQLHRMFEPGIAARPKEVARLQADRTLQAALRNPSPATLEAARRMLSPSPAPAVRRAELWDSQGKLLLAVVGRAPDSAQGFREYPPGTPPTRAGIGDIQAAGKFNYFWDVIEIRGDSSQPGPPLGYLRRFGRLSTTQAGLVARLIGDSALVRVGSHRTGVWTDLDAVVDPPPAAEIRNGAFEYRSSDGARWIGVTDTLEGTGWIEFVGFPRAMIIAPAEPFMERMVLLAVLFLIAGVTLALILGIRLTKPLHELVNAAEQIASGDYSRRVVAHRRDEIGRLGGAFNAMTNRIEAAYVALRKTHEQTHFALAAARIGVWESDITNGSLRCSASMHLLHRLPSGVLPETCEQFLDAVHEEDRSMVAAVLDGSAVRNDEFDIEYRVYGPGGSLHWIQGKGRLIRDTDREPVHVLGVSIDITERRRLEARFHQSQKMEAIGQLAGGIAHDFNNILTAIIGYGGMLLTELDDESELQTDVDGIMRAAESAAQMTHQLLAFSRGQILRPDVIDINSVIGSTRAMLSRLIGDHIVFVAEPGSDIHAVKVDASQLQQVLMNLAINARDAMPNGGKLTIASSNVVLDETYAASHPEVTPGEHVMISVSDSGTGMDPETQARLFEPFFTTKGPGHGTGLGLATVYGIVKQSGGHISVYSEPGCGATFRVYFPAVRESTTDIPQEITVAPESASGKERILVVDDNVAVRGVAKTILERLGYVVMIAGDGMEALEILKNADTRPKLLLTDVFLPGMTGPELYREVAALYPEIRAVFMSGYSPDAITPHAVLGTDFIFVEKPYTATTLAARVKEALQQQSM